MVEKKEEEEGILEDVIRKTNEDFDGGMKQINVVRDKGD